MTHSPTPHFRPAEAGEWRAAAKLLAAHLPAGFAEARADSIVRSLVGGELAPGELWVGLDRAGRLSGAMVAALASPELATVWPPAGPDALPLGRAVLAELAARGVRAAQYLAPPLGEDRWADPAAPARLAELGLPRVTELVTLDRPALPATPPTRLTRVPFAEAGRDLVGRMLVASYVGSADCPELNELRAPDDALGGYDFAFGGGGFVALDGANPVGLGVVAPDVGATCLVYLGLVPEARGRGLGRELLRHLLMRCEGPARVQADARNGPALRMYETEGFVRTSARPVYLGAVF